MAYHILVVDDEPDIEALFAQKFRRKIKDGEYVFYFAENGVAALEVLKDIPEIDVIFTDINMPVMDGITLLSKIKEQGLICKTNVVSAYGDLRNIRSAMNNGAYDFVIKPIELEDLEATLQKSLAENDLVKQGMKASEALEKALIEKAEAQQLALSRLEENEQIMKEQNVMLEKRVEERTEELRKEKQKADDLLLNILPMETAEELKRYGRVAPKYFEEVTVMFADFVDFTTLSADLTPEQLVMELNYCFSEFDRITEKYGVEKIKTIGDAYMCAEGVPVERVEKSYQIIEAARELIEFVQRNKVKKAQQNKPAFDIRIGLHTGPVMAGVVGLKKFSYDIWGDTVNYASRVEANSEGGKINISESTYERIKDKYSCEYRGEFEVKGKGMMKMYYLNI